MLRQPIALPIPCRSFCHCLFARETRSQMALREFHRHRIFNFTICENAMQKPSPNRSMERWMREHSITSTPIPITLIFYVVERLLL
jgi:hypothetical protein